MFAYAAPVSRTLPFLPAGSVHDILFTAVALAQIDCWVT
jgi:hypothetical protein